MNRDELRGGAVDALRLVFLGFRAAWGRGPWWRSPLFWAMGSAVAALVCDGLEEAPLLNALAMPLVFVSGLLWMGLLVLVAQKGPNELLGLVGGVFVLALVARIFYRLVVLFA